MKYGRDLKFENGGHMKTLHKITRHSDHLSGDFKESECNVQSPELEAIEPIAETIISAGPGRINSYNVSCVWRKKDREALL